MTPAACQRRNSDQLRLARLGAGSTPLRRRTAQTVLGATTRPSPASSPWIRRYPQLGFSVAKRRISWRNSLAIGGRPVLVRLRYVQRRRTSCWCQHKSVLGRKRNERHSRRGRTRLSAASRARSAGSSLGRAISRLSTCSWWRSTRISISFDRSERSHSTSSSSRHRNAQYRNDRATLNHPFAFGTAEPTHPCETQRRLVFARARETTNGRRRAGPHTPSTFSAPTPRSCARSWCECPRLRPRTAEANRFSVAKY
jgi:hypothetical protein